MSDRPARIYEAFLTFRRVFTIFAQTNPRYFHAFLRRDIGPRYLSIPKILLCTLGIAVLAPALRAVFPVITFAPLYLLPFAPHPFFPYFRDGNFTIHASEFWPFWIFAVAFVITAVRRHLEGERRSIDGEPLHSFSWGEPRFFKPEGAGPVKEPLIVFALGTAYSYAALISGAFHPAFGGFLMLGALDLALSSALMGRYWAITVQDQIDAELGAAELQKLHDDTLGGRGKQLTRPAGGLADQQPARFHRAGPGARE